MTHGILKFALIYAVDHDYDPFRPHNVIKGTSKNPFERKRTACTNCFVKSPHLASASFRSLSLHLAQSSHFLYSKRFLEVPYISARSYKVFLERERGRGEGEKPFCSTKRFSSSPAGSVRIYDLLCCFKAVCLGDVAELAVYCVGAGTDELIKAFVRKTQIVSRF